MIQQNQNAFVCLFNLVVNKTFVFMFAAEPSLFLQAKWWEANCWSQISFTFCLCSCFSSLFLLTG